MTAFRTEQAKLRELEARLTLRELMPAVRDQVRRVTRYMLETCPPPVRSAEELAERRKSSAMPRAASVGGLFPGLLRIYLPSYTPHDVKISPGIQVLADKYTKMATKTS